MDVYELNDLLLAAQKNLRMAQSNPDVFGRYAASYAQKGLSLGEQIARSMNTLEPSERVLLQKSVEHHRTEFAKILDQVQKLGVTPTKDLEFIT